MSTPDTCACGAPVLRTRSAVTGWPLTLDAALIPVVETADRGPAAARVGWRLGPAGAAVACTPGPHGWAGAGESHDEHRCEPLARIPAWNQLPDQ